VAGDAFDGHVAEWLRSGLQNRLPRFNSGRGLHHLAKYRTGYVNVKSTGSPLVPTPERARARPADGKTKKAGSDLERGLQRLSD
jgi:hypothetical protein